LERVQFRRQFAQRRPFLRLLATPPRQDVRRVPGLGIVAGEQRRQGSAQRINIGTHRRRRQSASDDFRRDIGRHRAEIHRGSGNTLGIGQPGQAEIGEQRITVVAYPQAGWGNAPVQQRWLIGIVRLMKPVQRPQRRAGIGQPRRQVPGGILTAPGQGGRGGIHQREKTQLAGIAVHILEGVQQTGDEGRFLPALQRFKFPPGQLRRLFVGTGGQIV